jgi:A/G-specific adenine glycosylase
MKNIFTERMLNWFSENARDLPWRKTYHPYHIWISEIMLQQTQLERAADYFTRWLNTFPDMDHLAASTEDQVLKAWEGLGYYSRARNILKTARILAQNHDSRIPADYQMLVKLPGIGAYTAGAILSIAYNQPFPAVDANVERIVARFFNRRGSMKDPANKLFARQKMQAFLPAGKARYFNQALMELGALICRPKNPVCERCPLSMQCASLLLGIVDQRPEAAASRKSIFIEMATGILLDKGKIYIQKRPVGGVWANLWEFAGGRLKPGEKPEDAVVREYLEETELMISPLRKITTTRHSYTIYRVSLHGFLCKLQGKDRKPTLHAAQEYRWVQWNELHNYPFPAGHRKLIEYINSKTEFRGLFLN